MDANQFLAEFGHIASAPSGVQRIRELILQLAIGSDLSERSVNDAPASHLFEANHAKQLELVAQRRLKRKSPLRQVEGIELPWSLPSSWMWCRLGDLTNYGQSPKVEFKDVASDTWVLELEDVEKGTSRLLRRVRARERKFQSTKNAFPKGAVLYGKLRPYLDKVLIADEDGVCTTEIATISFFHGIEAAYLRWYLKSPFFIRYASNSTHGMSLPRLGTDIAREALFPLPPLAEQKRIVAKLNELMALCDKLEAQQQQQERLGKILQTTTFNELHTAKDPQRLRLAWSRLQENTPDLLVGEHGMISLQDSLKKLAVIGHLAKWTQESPPVQAIADECAALKERYMCDGWLRKQKPVIAHGGPAVTYPSHWSVVSFDKVAVIIGGVTKGRDLRGKKVQSCEYLRVANVQRGFFDLTEMKYIEVPVNEIPKYHVERGDLLITEGGDWDKVGRTAVWMNDWPKCLHQNHVFKARIPSGYLLEDWVQLVFNSTIGREYFAAASKQTTNLSSINMTQLRSFPLPVPPLSEQRTILLALDRLLKLCQGLQTKKRDSQTLARYLADASVSAITGIRIEERESMKAPKTELVSALRIGTTPEAKDQAPLTAILVSNEGELPAKGLWGRSGLDIDAFYQQLKTEMSKGWIVQPEPAYVKEIEAS